MGTKLVGKRHVLDLQLLRVTLEEKGRDYARGRLCLWRDHYQNRKNAGQETDDRKHADR